MGKQQTHESEPLFVGVLDFCGQSNARIDQLLAYLHSSVYQHQLFRDESSALQSVTCEQCNLLVINALDDSQQALKFIKSLPSPTSCIVVCVASHKDKEFRTEALELGVRDVLQPRELTPRIFGRLMRFIAQEFEAKRQIEFRFRFEKLISQVSTSFIQLSGTQLDDGINQALRLLGEFANVDRSYILTPSAVLGQLTMTHEWHHQEVDTAAPHYLNLPEHYFMDLLDPQNPKAPLHYRRVSDVPERASALRELLIERGVKSFAMFPMNLDNNKTGFLGYAVLRQEQPWHEDAISLLEISSQIFTNALRRRQAEDALRDSENYYETLIEGLGEGILYCDRDDAVIHANSRFAQMTGYSNSELLGKKAYEILPDPEDTEDFKSYTSRRLTGISEAYEIRLRRKDGSKFWALINSTPVIDANGNIIGTLGAITDISERKQTTVALKNSEEKYRNLVETSSDLIWSVDTDGKWTFVNQASKLIYGYEPEEMLGKPFTEFMTEKQARKDIRAFEEILSGSKYFSYETTHIRKDGSEVQLSFNAITLHDSKGKVIGTSGTATDITEKKAAQAKLMDQKEFLRLVIDTNPNLIYVKEQDGRFSLVNRAMANLFRCSVDQLLGKRIDDIYPNLPDLAEFAEQDRTVLQTGITRIMPEERAIDPFTGEERWFHTIKKPLLGSDGLPKQVLGISTDLTGRRKAEEALKAVVEGTVKDTAKDFFHSLVHHLGTTLGSSFALVGVLDQSQEFIETLALWSRGEQLENIRYRRQGTPSEIVLQEGFTLFPENVNRLFPSAMAVQEHDIESYMGAPIVNSEGDRIGLLAVLSTEPMKDWPTAKYLTNIFAARAGAEIERLNAEAQRTSLQQQLTQSQKMEAIGQLAAGIAHDLNNALAAVTGHLQLMKMRDELTPALEESVHISLQGCDRASSLIDQLLGFSRQGKYNLESLSLQDLVTQTLKFLERVIDQRVEIITDFSDEELFVNVDQSQIQQALTNLIINAQHAIAENGVIQIRTGSRWISDPSRFNQRCSSGQYFYIEVQDSGKGISSEIHDKIFEPFFTTKPSRKGTGLGLAMVYGTMQHHDGWVALESKGNKGACFSLYFPKAEQESSTSSSSKVVELPLETREHGTIMLIDDEERLVALATEFFERKGFKVHTFTKPSQALKWYAENFEIIDTIVLDMKMPKMSGTTCFNKIQSINPNAAVVLLSGYIQDKAAQDLLNKGALKFFQKPVKYQELVAWIANELSVRQAA